MGTVKGHRYRRALAVAGLISLGSGIAMLTTAVRPTRAAATTASPAAGSPATPTPAAGTAGPGAGTAGPSLSAGRQFDAQVAHLKLPGAPGTTKQGPHMYDPATGKPFKSASTVTVSTTANLTNQQVQVSWTNFTPSTALVYSATTVYYPVMVAECKGSSPASPAACYGAENGGVTSTSGAFGPMNTSYSTTGPNGTGVTDVQIFTGVENQFLACSQSSPCSLVIVPAQGGNFTTTPPKCKDHSVDTGFGGTADGAIDFGSLDYKCSWGKRIVIPLSFAKTPATCALQNAVFSAAGSPMAARAIESWRSALCVGSHGIPFNYNSQVAEPLALTEAGAGQADVAFTTLPAAAEGINTGTNKFVYAPIAVSAVAIAYWFDDPVTGLPDNNVRLNARLILKLLTQSYSFLNDGCVRGVPPPPQGCDNGVDGNPLSLFSDPEFTNLNKTVAQPQNGSIVIPTVESGQSDMTWVVTSWIDANKNAAAFLAGQPDQYTTHINANFLNLQYPNNTFIGQDPYTIIAHEYFPVFPLSLAATDQVENWPPGDNYTKDFFGNYDRLPPQLPGTRALIAILDEASSAAYLFPTAEIPNASGNYVTPTAAGMKAALKHMTSLDGTLQVNVKSTDKAAYPLTMVIYAMVPTSGITHAKAVAIAKFLQFAAGPGQRQGLQPGQLPPGFLPLPASMRKQTLKDARKVLRQAGATPTPAPTLPTGSPSPAATPGKGGSVSLPGISPSPGGGGPPVGLVPVAHVSPATIFRFALPVLLILGGLAALGGSSSIVGSAPAAAVAGLRRIGHDVRALPSAARRLVTKAGALRRLAGKRRKA